MELKRPITQKGALGSLEHIPDATEERRARKLKYVSSRNISPQLNKFCLPVMLQFHGKKTLYGSEMEPKRPITQKGALGSLDLIPDAKEEEEQGNLNIPLKKYFSKIK
ncbi:hypothetical protein CDAR_490331 [Caerostris darwini]|uniref:Uncharacterized protein n=1 Tax=Caerostris darwini TaxID=1538125 RepID=A0AAV4R395_9ARAC|nr:hypothetical protein CDAR_490331 [Caerostris darwini]